MLSIFDLHASKARYEQNVVLLHLWRIYEKTRPRIYLHYLLADLFIGNTAPSVAIHFLMNKAGEFSIKLGQMRQDAPSSCSVSSQLRVFCVKIS
jgi:hypothetical protein